MKDTSKVKVYLINAYSNYEKENFFISGSDRVAIELASCDSENSIILGPATIKQIIPQGIVFYSSQDSFTKNILIDYLIRTLKTIWILQKLEFDFIISSSDFFCDTVPGAIFSKNKKWFAFTFHLYPAFSVNFKLRDFFGKLFQDFSYLLFNKSEKIFTSNFECVDYLESKFKIQNVKKIPLGVHLNEFSSSNKKDIDVLFLGRIKDSKGIFDLPEIILNVKSKISNIKVVVIGNGPNSEKKLLEDLNKKFKSNLKILGSVSDQEVKQNLSKAKILIQLDSEGGFGLNIIEALASGCVIVGYDLPSYRDNFSDLELYMSSQKDKMAVAQSIIYLVENFDFTSNQRAKLKRFDWKEIYKVIFYN